MALIRRTGLKRGHPPRRTRPPKRQGKRGQRGSEQRLEARRSYFEAFGTVIEDQKLAPCQVCGWPVSWEWADAAHKVKRSLQAGNDPERVIIVHGFRSGPVNCHAWSAQRDPDRILTVSPVNSVTGGIVEWGQLEADLEQMLQASVYGLALRGIYPRPWSPEK